MPKKIEPFYESLGSRIHGAREQKRLTQAQLGLSLQPPSTRASIANIENGKQRVLVHTLVQLAGTLGVGIQDLLPAAGSPNPEARPRDVERELKRKLNLDAPQLKKLAVAAHLSTASRGKQV
jgi:transcriptional regulator with XRE-family HTH domain